MSSKIAEVFITGNSQSYEKPAGLHALQKEHEDKYRCHKEVEVYQCIEWKTNMDAFGSMLYADGVKRLIVYGYSYGFGYGTQKLCRYIEKRNKKMRKQWWKKGKKFKGHKHPDEISIIAVVGCDGVGRSRWLPTSPLLYAFQIRSMTDLIHIHIPDIVQNVYGLRQRENRPAGHKYKWRGKKITPSTYATDRDGTVLNHSNMDESARWHELVKQVVIKHLPELE